MLSGGADSMAMLALVGATDRRLGLGLELCALHVDYGLRGDDSTRDREIVARACAEAGLELEVVCLEAGLHGPNFQARARDLRYGRARALAAARGCDVIATAHNRDDQAETILYRLAKYASPQALVGMRPREAGAPGRADLARPLLCLGAAEIRAFCAARGIEFGEDVTNAEPVYARNVVRHEILTRLAELNPRVVETLAAGAEIAAAEREVLDAVAHDAWARVAAPAEAGDVAALSLDRLAREPEALRTLCLRALIVRARGAEALVERRETESLARLVARRDDAGSVSLRGGWEVARGGGLLRLRRRAPEHVCAPVTLAPGEAGARFCGRAYTASLAEGAIGAADPLDGRHAGADRRESPRHAPRGLRRPRRSSGARRPPSPGARRPLHALRHGPGGGRRTLPRRGACHAARAPLRPRPGGRRACRLGGLRVSVRRAAGEGCAAAPRVREYGLHAPRRRGGRVKDPIAAILVPPEELAARVDDLAREISKDYAGQELLLVGVLKGAVFFMADLARRITVPCALDFMAVSSYGSSTDSSGVVRILKDLDTEIEGRHVLIVEDIIDSGLTLSYLLKNLRSRKPASLEICALLTKPARRRTQIACRYVGFEIPDEFVVGYGLDYAEHYRALDFIGVLTPEAVAAVAGDGDSLL